MGVIENNSPPESYVEWEKKFWKSNVDFTWSEVAKHKKEGDVWIVLDNQVYDVTEYIQRHPGG